MATLPANSTFLPVLDDLLSPDFRPFSMPGQTPQTPAETPVSATAPKAPSFGESHTGQLTGRVSFGETKQEIQFQKSQHNGTSSSAAVSVVKGKHHDVYNHMHQNQNNHNHAAEKIQKWWKSRKGKARLGNGTSDIKAERVKHSIRHNRTEDHVRYLETEVHRLKSALATERKLRSLQLEAIRSLWSQVQKVSSVSSSPPSAENSIMSQSMPNGLPIGSKVKETSSGIMTMSLHTGLDQQQKQVPQEATTSSCACTKEIQNLRESLTGEMVQLRQMIDQLRVDGNEKGESSENGDQSRVSLQKRPLTLNLVGISSKDASEQVEPSEINVGPEKKKEISGYADQMASSILVDAVDKDDDKE